MRFSFSELDFSEGYAILTNKGVSGVVGSRVWLIGGEGTRPMRYYLCCCFIAEEAGRCDLDTGYKNRVEGNEGIAPDSPIYLNDLAWFPEFRREHQNFSLGFRTMVSRFVPKFEELLVNDDRLPSASEGEVAGISTNGAGFGNAETNRKVEQAAVKAVRHHYESKGWQSKSVEADKCGYDLLCNRNSTEKHVEVKGVQGGSVSFIITANEVKTAQTDSDFVLCVVTNVLSDNPELHEYDAEEFLRQFSLDPISYRACRKGSKRG